MLRIWGRKTSINVQKVMWVVGELGLEHERIDAGGPFGGLDTPEFLALNPNGVIPVLEDGGRVIWESNSIARYLALAYGKDNICPADLGERALADQWMEYLSTTFYPDFISCFLGIVRTAPSKRDNEAIAAAAARTGKRMEMLNRQLDGKDYILGDSLTMGDVPLGSMLYRYFTLEIDRPNLPNVEAWYERLKARNAYEEHVMIDYQAMRVTD
ncbi:MAG: glutathione S-transferase N-terminal domain-containing protein [Kiloniellales bacterium]|nr:glutathione S-transferase N-terminal domain-containing protein [Kiloniellales bacterium]